MDTTLPYIYRPTMKLLPHPTLSTLLKREHTLRCIGYTNRKSACIECSATRAVNSNSPKDVIYFRQSVGRARYRQASENILFLRPTLQFPSDFSRRFEAPDANPQSRTSESSSILYRRVTGIRIDGLSTATS